MLQGTLEICNYKNFQHTTGWYVTHLPTHAATWVSSFEKNSNLFFQFFSFFVFFTFLLEVTVDTELKKIFIYLADFYFSRYFLICVTKTLKITKFEILNFRWKPENMAKSIKFGDRKLYFYHAQRRILM